MVSFGCQLGWVTVPVIQTNTNIGVAGKVFCRCGLIYNQLTLRKELTLDYLGLHLISQKASTAKEISLRKKTLALRNVVTCPASPHNTYLHTHPRDTAGPVLSHSNKVSQPFCWWKGLPSVCKKHNTLKCSKMRYACVSYGPASLVEPCLCSLVKQRGGDPRLSEVVRPYQSGLSVPQL